MDIKEGFFRTFYVKLIQYNHRELASNLEIIEITEAISFPFDELQFIVYSFNHSLGCSSVKIGNNFSNPTLNCLAALRKMIQGFFQPIRQF